ncbi:MAG: glycerate kinase [Alphaproteobacteria bacterium]|nr:glycerate kinase [Alphaproteobacteria bacterium]
MKILIVPDSFKECLTAAEIADIIGSTTEDCGHTAVCLPMADGGEGFASVLAVYTNAQERTVPAHDALMRPIMAPYFVTGTGTVILEAADTFGLAHIEPEKRNPLLTTTFGMGEQIAHALKAGYRRFIIGLGGSATNDCGIGLMQALGFILLNAEGKPLPCGAAGKDLASVAKVIAPDIKADITLAVDVSNPLLGPNGAATVYAPQKGADFAAVALLEKGARSFFGAVENSLNKQLSLRTGLGAAGGAGLPFYAYFQAKFQSGIDLILSHSPFETELQTADLIITGEGRIDAQTVFGKVPVGVAKRSGKIPVIAVCGCTGQGFEAVCQAGIKAVYPITPENTPFAQAKRNAPVYLKETVVKILREYAV